MSPRRKGARPPWATDDGPDPLKRGALKLALGAAALAWVLALLHEPQEERYGRSHGTSLRALMERAEVAALAELTSEDSAWGPYVATYRVESVFKGPIEEGEQLEVIGPDRLPYHGRSSGFLFGPIEYYEARPGHRAFLFLRHTPDGERYTVADPSGALHVRRLVDWARRQPEGVEKAFLPRLEQLAGIQATGSGPERETLEKDWLLQGLEQPLTSERAAADLVSNWRSGPEALLGTQGWNDASDARALLEPDDLERLRLVLEDRRYSRWVRDDMAWLLSDVASPAVDAALTRELLDRLAVAAFDPDTERGDRLDPDELFPVDFSAEFDVHSSGQLLAVLAFRAQDAELDARREGWLEAELDADEVRAYRRFTERWLELQGPPPGDGH
jgi:hypothetical protein